MSMTGLMCSVLGYGHHRRCFVLGYPSVRGNLVLRNRCKSTEGYQYASHIRKACLRTSKSALVPPGTICGVGHLWQRDDVLGRI